LKQPMRITSHCRKSCLLKLGPTVLAAFVVGRAAMAAERPTAEPDTWAKHVEPMQAQGLIEQKKVVVLDIRTPEEFKGGRIAGATNINFRAPDFEKQIGQLDKEKSYLVHCASGGRSTASLKVFKKLQFKSIYHLDGGIGVWQKAGLPVERPKD